MNGIIAFGIVGLIGGLWSGPLANAVGVDMPWFAQFGLCGVFAMLLWWALAKTLPQISADSKEAAVKVAAENKEGQLRAAQIHAEAFTSVCSKLDEVCDESKGVRAEIRAGNDAQLAMLRNVLHQQNKGMGS